MEDKRNMTNQEILKVAMKQSAIDLNCDSDDFMSCENKIVFSRKHPDARRYLELPFVCNLVSYGNNIVASTQQEYEGIVKQYIEKYPAEHCFETPNMHVINDAFKAHDMCVCFMAEYFLPDVLLLKELDCGYELRILQASDFSDLYVDAWSNVTVQTTELLHAKIHLKSSATMGFLHSCITFSRYAQ